MPDDALIFGPFALHLQRRELTEAGRPLRVGSRALDILMILTERPGEVIGKDELLARVWPNTTVEETNLRVHIAGLRKVLRDGVAGSRYIINVAGRGYSFVTAVTYARAERPPALPAAEGRGRRLPVLTTRVIGRSDIAVDLAAKLATRRLVTIVGPGGIGKTTLGLAVAAAVAPQFRDGVVFVDLAPLADPALVASTTASALGIALPADDPFSRLGAFLNEKHMLLFLDNCEHVVREAAGLAERLIHHAPRIHVLATSREPLRVEGEWTERLLPLATPPAAASLSAADAVAFPAIELFAERAAASTSGFALKDADVATAVAICRQLDGIPLAIELAAASVEAFGLTALATLLDDRFAVLTRGRRTALPRQQTLRATLDWSYGILPATEQAVLRRLAIFRGWFTAESACSIAAGPTIPSSAALDALSNLVSKSLIVTDANDTASKFRLLDTTRVYALRQLADAGETSAVYQKYAEHFCSMFEMLEAAWQGRPVAAALTPYTHTIDDIRAALGWSFAPDGDATIGLRLTAASANLWFHLSLMDEYRTQVEAALAILRRAPSPDGAIELRLLIALGHAIYHSQGPGPQMAEAFTRGLALAEQFHSTAQQLQAVWGLWAVRSTSGDYPASLVLAEKYAQLAHGFGDEDTALFADRTLALSFHWLGEHEQAWQHTQSTLAHPSTIVRRTPGNGFQLNHQAAGRPIIARVHWMRGYPDQALATAKQIMADALLVEHPPSACYVLAVAACPVAIWAGDFALAHSLTAILRRTATENALTFWQMFARCYEFALSYIDPENGEIVVGVDEFARDPRLGLRHLETLSTLHPDLLSAKVLADLEAGSTTWSRPEILRAKGERILRHGGHQAAESAEACFQQSIEIARQQQALSWELRAAISLARLWRDSGRGADGHRQLQAAYGRFGEGFGTTDLMTAAQLLRELGSPQ